MINGQVVGPLNEGELLVVEDFRMIESTALAGVAGTVAKKFNLADLGAGVTTSARNDLVVRVCAVLSTAAKASFTLQGAE